MVEAVGLLFVSIFKVQIGIKQCIDNGSGGGTNVEAGNGFRMFACHYTPNTVSDRRFQKLMSNNMTCPISKTSFDWTCVKTETIDTELDSPPPVSRSESCSTDTDCRWLKSNATCHEGRCRCIPTLLYSPSRKACIRCTIHSSTFSAYPGFGIADNLGRAIHQVPSQELCANHCINEKMFYCKAAEYSPKNYGMLSDYPQYTCLLHNVSYYEVETSLTSSLSHYAWILLLRGCY